MGMMRLAGKIAVIVGAGQSPGEGIGNGRATVLRFAQEGAKILAVDRDLASAEETAALAAKSGDECIAFQADVQIRNPDVNGSVYLDAHTYQIRRADLQLTKIPPGLPQVTAVSVTTMFGEISPSIVVITAYDAGAAPAVAHKPSVEFTPIAGDAEVSGCAGSQFVGAGFGVGPPRMMSCGA